MMYFVSLFSLITFVLALLGGCVSTSKLQDSQAYFTECMAWENLSKKKEGYARESYITSCEIGRDRIARGIDPDASYAPYYPESSSSGGLLGNAMKEEMQWQRLKCIARYSDPWHC